MRFRLLGIVFAVLLFVPRAAFSDGITVQPGEMVLGVGGVYTSNLDGLSYVRTWIDTSCTYCGCYYASGYYRYVAVPAVAATYTLPAIDDRNFEKKVADILVLQENRRQQAQLHNERLELVQQLGLTGTDRPALATPLRYSAATSFAGRYGVTGSTLFAPVTYQVVSDAYNTLDTNLAFQGSAAYGQISGANFDRATAGYNSNLQTALNGQARVAEINAKGLAVARALTAANGAPQVQTTATLSGLDPNALPDLSVNTGNGGGLFTARPRGRDKFALAAASCIACHGDSRPLGNYRVSQHRLLSPERQAEIFSRHIVTDDPAQLMPRLASDHSKPGQPLPLELAIEFLSPKDRVEAVKAMVGGR